MRSLRPLDSGLNRLTEQLIWMGGNLEQALHSATEAWRARNLGCVQEVYDIEREVNASHVAVDAKCLQLLALQQPLAVDLRQIISAIKINNDLERMVDLAVNIANNTEYYLRSTDTVRVDELSQLSDEIKLMVREVLDAFVHTDENMALRVLERDDRVDALKEKILNDVIDQMKVNQDAVEQGLNVILIAKNLERIGDHATNIAEDIIFTASGRDIRHSGKI